MPSKKANVCAWCGYPGAIHNGGFRRPGSHNIEVEVFCSEEHFDRWLVWREMLSQIDKQPQPSIVSDLQTVIVE